MEKELQEKFKALFPTYPMVIATLIAFVLVILILWFLLHKPISKAIKERRKFIQKNIDDAKATNELSQNKLKEANLRLAEAYKEADDLVKDAKIQGENVLHEYTERAKIEAKRIIEEAKVEIDKGRQELINESKNNIAKAAVEISKQILKNDISKKSQEEIIDNFLKEKAK